MKFGMSLQRRAQILWEMQKLHPETNLKYPEVAKGLCRAFNCCEKWFDFDMYGSKAWIDQAWLAVCTDYKVDPRGQFYSFNHLLYLAKKQGRVGFCRNAWERISRTKEVRIPVVYK